MINTLDRYLFRATLGPLFFGMAAFASIFIGSDLINLAQMAVNLGVPLGVVARLIFYKVPQILVWTLPMSVLLATILTLSRLSANSEIVVMQTSGVPLRRVMAPFLALGLLVTALTMFIGDTVVPEANLAYQRLLAREVQKSKLVTVSRNVLLQDFQGEKVSRIIYAEEYDSSTQTMREVSITEFENGRPVRQTNAARLVWENDTWYLENGVMYVFGQRQGNQSGVARLEFLKGRRRFTMNRTPTEIQAQEKRPEEMTMHELATQARLWRGDLVRSRFYETQYHLRIAIPFASLLFSLLGVPLGIQPHRMAKSIGFGLSIVVIFIYYILLTLGTTLAQGGYLAPWLGTWLQNLALLLAGILLLSRVRR